jgi:hypothetical protein
MVDSGKKTQTEVVELCEYGNAQSIDHQGARNGLL